MASLEDDELRLELTCLAIAVAEASAKHVRNPNSMPVLDRELIAKQFDHIAALLKG